MSMHSTTNETATHRSGEGVGRLPIGVWTRCWAHVDAKLDLQAFSLVCSAFRRPCQALLFSELTFTGHGLRNLTKKERPTMRALNDRLRALLRSPLAAHVRALTLRNWSSGSPDTIVWETTEMLYTAIWKFTGLQSATCERVLLTSGQFQNLCYHAGLRRLEMRECMFPFDDTPRYLQDIVIVEKPAEDTTSASSDRALADSTTAILNPETLRALVIDMPRAVGFLLPMLEARPSFQHLHTLNIVLSAKDPYSSLLPLVQKCPTLRQLKIAKRSTTDAERRLLPTMSSGQTIPGADTSNCGRDQGNTGRTLPTVNITFEAVADGESFGAQAPSEAPRLQDVLSDISTLIQAAPTLVDVDVHQHVNTVSTQATEECWDISKLMDAGKQIIAGLASYSLIGT